MTHHAEGKVAYASASERSLANKVVAASAAGSDYLQVDATLVVLSSSWHDVTGGLGLLGYVVLVVLMPLPGQPRRS